MDISTAAERPDELEDHTGLDPPLRDAPEVLAGAPEPFAGAPALRAGAPERRGPPERPRPASNALGPRAAPRLREPAPAVDPLGMARGLTAGATSPTSCSRACAPGRIGCGTAAPG
jgi:hypothetical protein